MEYFINNKEMTEDDVTGIYHFRHHHLNQFISCTTPQLESTLPINLENRM